MYKLFNKYFTILHRIALVFIYLEEKKNKAFPHKTGQKQKKKKEKIISVKYNAADMHNSFFLLMREGSIKSRLLVMTNKNYLILLKSIRTY